MPRKTGVVRTVHEAGRYGFIQTRDGGDFYFHLSRVRFGDVPETGAAVSFVSEPDRQGRGMRAVDVEVINAA
jgi:cold shock CspA family protein